jgi:uncharacterized repeat protein (TIGR01451 family)
LHRKIQRYTRSSGCERNERTTPCLLSPLLASDRVSRVFRWLIWRGQDPPQKRWGVSVTKTEAKDHGILNFYLLLTLVPVAILLPALPAQAQSERGIVTTQTIDPGPATVGQPHAFTVAVTNNSVPQSVGLKDFLPPNMALESATPSQGTCNTNHHGANGVECTLGKLPSGGSAMVEIVGIPTIPGTATNTAVGGGELAPADPNNATIAVNPAPGQQGTGEAHGGH